MWKEDLPPVREHGLLPRRVEGGEVAICLSNDPKEASFFGDAIAVVDIPSAWVHKTYSEEDIKEEGMLEGGWAVKEYRAYRRIPLRRIVKFMPAEGW